ncbi:MAG: hypothetical protein J1G04_01700 [Clostridiales bacterium]|nr:hypothetical protein [Clostridiales bacterium]
MTTSDTADNIKPVDTNTAYIDEGLGSGTGKHTYPDFKSAYRAVPDCEKRRAFTMLIAAGVTIGFLLLSRLIWLFEPLLDRIYYGTLSEIVYYMILGLLYSIYIVVLNEFIKKHCNVKLFRRKRENISIARALACIAIAAAAVLFTGAYFNFKLKMQVEMGMGVTLATALTNIAVYIYYGLHIWLGFTAALLVQYACSMLFPAKYTVPWGAIFLVTVFGLIELIFELFTTNHLYPWLYYLYTYAYAAIFMLTKRSFHISYWASALIMGL